MIVYLARDFRTVCNVFRQWKPRSSLLIESTDSMIIITNKLLSNPQCILLLKKTERHCTGLVERNLMIPNLDQFDAVYHRGGRLHRVGRLYK